MPREQSPGRPTTRRYSDEEKAAAVRMVRTLRAGLRFASDKAEQELGIRYTPIERTIADEVLAPMARCVFLTA